MCRLNVVVTCADKKGWSAPDELMLRNVERGPIENRFQAWIGRLQAAQGSGVPAADLYKGNHWHVVLSLAQSAARTGIHVNVWIASAGYGLVPITARIHPYAATFANGRDSVGAVRDAQQWWRHHGEWHGPSPGAPRSVEQLAAADPGTPLLLAMSSAYARALRCDVELALQRPSAADQIAVISAGSVREQALLERVLLPTNARFRSLVGGQMHALNVRLLKHALEIWPDWAGDVGALRRIFSEELRACPPVLVPQRRQLGDAEVLEFIEQELQSEPAAGHSTLLRRLRASGRACEQNRFRRLYRSFTASPAS